MWLVRQYSFLSSFLSQSTEIKQTKFHRNGKIQYVIFLLRNIKGKKDNIIS